MAQIRAGALLPTICDAHLRVFISLWANILKGLLTRVRASFFPPFTCWKRKSHMQRLLVRIAALALSASALSACSMFGGSADNAANIPTASGQANTAVPADVNVAVHQAQVLRNSGDNPGATRILSQLMLTSPDNAAVVGEYGKLLVQENRAQLAVQFLHRAVELQPSDWTLYSAMGVAYDQLSDQANARLAYEHALSLKPGEAAILNNYAMSRMLAGDTVAARALMARAQASGSSDPKIARNLALLNQMTPAKPVAPAAQASAVSPASVVPRAVVATNAIAPVAPAAHGAPVVITRRGTQVVMQEVPVDALAGPTGTKHLVKTAKAAKRSPAPQHLAVNAVKPSKKAKPVAGDHIPALRMTADASKP